MDYEGLDIREILKHKKAVVVFDIDGTLLSYNYGKRYAHHEADIAEDEERFLKADIYKNAKGIPLIRKYIKRHSDNIYLCLSKEPHGQENSKAKRIEQYYGIRARNCHFAIDIDGKISYLQRLRDDYGFAMPIIYIDDNDDTLMAVEKELHYADIYTAHVTIFFEEGGCL